MPVRYFADISSNNVRFDAGAYHRAGHVLVAIKATEGTTYDDPRYMPWLLRAHHEGVGVVHYHFARPDLGNAPDAEADFFLDRVLHHTGPRDYLALDLERGVDGDWGHDPVWSYDFDRRVRERSRFHTILYISGSRLAGREGWLYGDNRRVWIADWGDKPTTPPLGYVMVFWQFTDGVTGRGPHLFAGVGRCDGDLMSRAVFGRLTQC